MMMPMSMSIVMAVVMMSVMFMRVVVGRRTVMAMGNHGAIFEDVGVAVGFGDRRPRWLVKLSVGGFCPIRAAAGYAHSASVSNSLMVSSSPWMMSRWVLPQSQTPKG